MNLSLKVSIAICLLLPLVVSGCKQFKINPDPATIPSLSVEDMLIDDPLLRQIPIGMYPFYMLGDVDGDGQINEQDWELIDQLIAGSLEETPCNMAADISRNGVIDQADLDMFEIYFLEPGSVSNIPLYAQPALRCKEFDPILAARVDVFPGDSIPIRLLTDMYAWDSVFLEINGPVEGIIERPDEKGWDILVNDAIEFEHLIAIDLQLPGGNIASIIIPIYIPDVDLFQDDPLFPLDPDISWYEPAEDCPQRSNGMEILTIDFFSESNIILFDDFREILINTSDFVGANTQYVAPKFRRNPAHARLIDGNGTSFQLPALPVELADIRAYNLAEWVKVRDALLNYQGRIRQGCEVAWFQVFAHGSKGACGHWGPGFYAHSAMPRKEVLMGNYYAARGNVCANVTHDMSCFGAISPRIMDELNNLGTTHCQPTQEKNIRHHAGYELDFHTAASNGVNPVIFLYGAGHLVAINDILEKEIMARRDAEAQNGKKEIDYSRLIQSMQNDSFFSDPNTDFSSYSDHGYARCKPELHQERGI